MMVKPQNKKYGADISRRRFERREIL